MRSLAFLLQKKIRLFKWGVVQIFRVRMLEFLSQIRRKHHDNLVIAEHVFKYYSLIIVRLLMNSYFVGNLWIINESG